MILIDLNADLGEGASTDAAIMPWITSANISCGAHAGEEEDLRTALALARQYGVVPGAHPGFPDRVHHGRLPISGLTAETVRALIEPQIIRLDRLAADSGMSLKYVKPHGALYHQFRTEPAVRAGVLSACASAERQRVGGPGEPWPILGLPDHAIAEELELCGRRYVLEGFADRRYQADGTLVPRGAPGAVLEDPKEVLEQVMWLIHTQHVRSLCVHGDTPGAREFLRVIRSHLAEAGFGFSAFASRL
jgi:UPF0271 protein